MCIAAECYVRFGFLRFYRYEKWSHRSRLDPRHQIYKVCLLLRKPNSDLDS